MSKSPALNQTTNSSFTTSTIGYIKPYSVFGPMVKSTVGLAKKRFKSLVIMTAMRLEFKFLFITVYQLD